MSHHRFPAAGLLGADALTFTPPPPNRFFKTRRLATPARAPIAADGIAQDDIVIQRRNRDSLGGLVEFYCVECHGLDFSTIWPMRAD